MPENEAAECFIILVRHASREVRWDKSEAIHKIRNEQHYPRGMSDFKTKGEPLTYSLAGRLCDALEDLDTKVKKIICSEHLAAMQTAKIYKEVIKKRGLFCGDEPETNLNQGEPWLTPNKTSRKTINTQVDAVVTEARATQAGDANPQTKSVYILVGHQPYLTEIARHLLKGKLPSNSLPLEGSEAACLHIDGKRRRLCWLITEKPTSLLNELKDKIKSKFDVAKFFLGAFVVNTGLLLNAGIWSTGEPQNTFAPTDKVLVVVAIIAAMASLALSAATLFSYDKLMMPEAFWSDNSKRGGRPTNIDKMASNWSVSRPPSQVQVVLFYEMVHVWKVFFIPAIFSAFLAIGLLVVAFAHRAMLVPATWRFGVDVFVTFFLVVAFYYWKRSKLGFED
jgi:phosphohistidine phosphatase SixA